jgi:Cu/Ag efflux pump CusA
VEVGSLFEQQKVFEVVVWSTPETRHSLTSIRELPIDTPSGEFVRLGDLAEVRFTPSPMSIKHDAVSRYIDVSANVRGRNVDAVARDVEERLAEVQFPLEHHAEVLGELQERQANERRLLGFALAAVLGIFLLLQAAFGSWRLATLVFLSLPLAMAGGLLAAYLAGDMISLGALIGFLTVLGIAARNSCVLIDRFQRLARDEGLAIGPELIQRGARERLAPVLMTALATGLALVPLLLIGNGPGYEIAHPIAVITAGGLVTATLVTLFVVPALYGRLAPGSQRQTAGSHVSPGPNISPAPVTDD